MVRQIFEARSLALATRWIEKGVPQSHNRIGTPARVRLGAFRQFADFG